MATVLLIPADEKEKEFPFPEGVSHKLCVYLARCSVRCISFLINLGTSENLMNSRILLESTNWN